MASQNWKAGIGPDTHVHELNERVVLVNVHMSNDEAKFIGQKNKLAELIKSYPSRYVIVTGDFNAQLKLDDSEGQRLYFHSKDIEPLNLDAEHATRRVDRDFVENPPMFKDEKSGRDKAKFHGYMVLPNRAIVLGVPLAPTTNKVRIITTQLGKILKPVAATIDWCFVVTPDGGYGSNVNISSNVKVGELDPSSSKEAPRVIEREVGADEFAPASWCSDHFMLDTEVSIEGTPYRIGSLNVLGESVDAGAKNHFEFVDQDAYREILTNDEAVKKRIEQMRDAFLDDFVADLKNEASPDKAILGQVYTKFFVEGQKKVIPREAITRKNIIGNKVFGLVKAKFMNIHCMKGVEDAADSAKMAETCAKYDAERTAFFAKTDEVTKFLCNRLQDGFFQKLYADADIHRILSGLFHRQSNKLDFKDCLRHFLGDGRFTAFAIQEVGSGRMYSELTDRKFANFIEFPGYTTLVGAPVDTTTGALIVKNQIETPVPPAMPPAVLPPAAVSQSGWRDLAKVGWEKAKMHWKALLAAAVVIACIVLAIYFGTKKGFDDMQATVDRFVDDVTQGFRESVASFKDL